MPTYDYQCLKCEHRFEVFHSMTDETRRRCPVCKGRARRVPSAGAGLLFKGSGFYITDYRSKSYTEKAKKEKTSGTAAGGSEGSAGEKAKPAGPAGESPTRRTGDSSVS